MNDAQSEAVEREQREELESQEREWEVDLHCYRLTMVTLSGIKATCAEEAGGKARRALLRGTWTGVAHFDDDTDDDLPAIKGVKVIRAIDV